MQVQTQENRKVYENRTQILEKAVGIVKRIHDVAIWVLRQTVPEADYFEMPSFEIEWLRSEVKRLWDLEITKEEAIYIWEKGILGF